MKTRWALMLVLTLLLINCGGDGGNPQPAPIQTGLQPTLSATLDDYLNANLNNELPGLSVLVRKDGQIAYQRSVGRANRHTNLPLSRQTGFRLASVSKPFTALAIMQLYERGLLELSDTVMFHLPELADQYANITLHQLLVHESGILDFVNDADNLDYLDGLANGDVIREFLNPRPPEFPAGQRAEYSNTGYILLAEVVARVSGMSFADYMELNLFLPLQMRNSYVIDGQFPESAEDALNYAETASIFGFESVTNGSSSQVSSVADIDNFLQAFLADQVLQTATRELMLRQHSVIGSGPYAYGWQVGEADGSGFSHSGSWDGFQTNVVVDPTKQFHVVVLSNGGQDTLRHNLNLIALVRQFYASL